MLTSGLVSLNVHEALAFDGTEICLHPDLFSFNVLPGPTSSDTGSALPQITVSVTNAQARVSLNHSGSLDGNVAANNNKLRPGDIIEVRVWDPLVGMVETNAVGVPVTNNSAAWNSAKVASTSAIIRRKTGQSLSALQQTNIAGFAATSMRSENSKGTIVPDSDTPGQSVEDSIQNADSRAPDPTVCSTPLKTGAPSADATSVSESQLAGVSVATSSSASNASADRDREAETNAGVTIPASTRTALASGGMPPLVPRGRSSDAPTLRMQLNPNVTKLSYQRRSTPGENSTQGKLRSIVAPSGQSSTFPVSGHVREISDVTTETLQGSDMKSGTAGGHWSAPGGDFLLHHVDSTGSMDDNFDEEEDAGWTNLTSSHILRLSFVMLLTEKSLNSLPQSARTQVSILRRVADLYDLSSYDMVTIGKIEKQDEHLVLEAVSADFVTLTIKDQFVSRGDMLFFQEGLIGNWIYEGKRLHEPVRGIQAHALEIRHGDQQARSGIITDKTTITFRSRSARFIWLVQMSVEMWDYAFPYEAVETETRCDLYFDKLISFLQRLFHRWKDLEVTHALTVVFFSRTFIGSGPEVGSEDKSDKANLGRDVYGRRYEDHFRIVIENVTEADWDSLVSRCKAAFVQYPEEVGWNLMSDESSRRPSSASQGNVLEAINVTLNLLQYHYLDRDLHRTGNSIVVVTPGSGVFEVDKGLAGITYQRMMDNGIGSDAISLALPPLHIAPFFMYVNLYELAGTEDVDAAETYYEVPHWMNLSFASYDSDGIKTDGSRNQDPWDRDDCIINSAGLLVGSNGFLLPRQNETAHEKSRSPQLRPKSFSAQGNAAASPKKQSQLAQTRQLIAGREFLDILEACRPKNVNLLPTALLAIIEKNLGSTKPNTNVADMDVKSSPIPQEWGTMTSSSTHGIENGTTHRIVPLGGEFVKIGSPGALSPPIVDELDTVEPSSHHSSFVSHLSNHLFRIAVDRSVVSTQGQMQRCPSLDYDEKDGEVSLSMSDPHSNQDSESEFESYVRKLRRMMKLHDQRASSNALSSPNLLGQTEYASQSVITDQDVGRLGKKPLILPQKGGSANQQRVPLSGQGSGVSGIGAALTHYRATSSGLRLTKLDSDYDSNSIHRTSSTKGLVSGVIRVTRHPPESTPRGLSPLMLPPVTNSSHPFPDSSASLKLHEERGSPSRDALGSSGLLVKRNSLWGKGDVRHDRRHFPSLSSFSISPPAGTRLLSGSLRHDRPGHRPISRSTGHKTLQGKSLSGSRRKKAFNPFREQDEDEVLAKNSHNRRRWSHVFAAGEIEFRRRTGPSWKSLTAPAILPLFVGYFPTQSEVDHSYTFSINNITLKEFDRTYFSSNKDLLMEMVRQRLTQDYQLVPTSHVNTSNLRRETLRDGLANRGLPSDVTRDNKGLLRQFLSMGHRIQVLTYDPESDIIEITRYDLKRSQSNAAETVKYHYQCYCEETKQYNRVVQKFSKYSRPYNWSKVDRIVCGDDDREMREGMRFRRIMFGLIPQDFKQNKPLEKEYIVKFQRLLEYFNKLREKETATTPALDIRIVTSSDDDISENGNIASTPGIARNSMQRFYVELRKRKSDPYEWMEVVVDSTFHTMWSYRIMFHWLVASPGKVDAQIQVFQRRCSQFGLELIPFPQITVSRNSFLNPFRAPNFFVVKDPAKADGLDTKLMNFGYVHDGVFNTDIKSILECADPGLNFDVGNRRWVSSILGRQFVHRSGTLFVRLLTDNNGITIIVTHGNYLYFRRDPKMAVISQDAFQALARFVESL